MNKYFSKRMILSLVFLGGFISTVGAQAASEQICYTTYQNVPWVGDGSLDIVRRGHMVGYCDFTREPRFQSKLALASKKNREAQSLEIDQLLTHSGLIQVGEINKKKIYVRNLVEGKNKSFCFIENNSLKCTANANVSIELGDENNPRSTMRKNGFSEVSINLFAK